MKKVVFIISLFFLVGNFVPAKTPQSQVDSLAKVIDSNGKRINTVEDQLDQASKHIEHLEYAVDKQKEIIVQEQMAIGNSLGAASCLLAVFSLIIAIGGFILGWYISKKKKEVEKLLSIVEAKKIDVTKTSKEITDLNDEIKNNIKGLYKRLRQEETTTLLERLVEVPEDIENLSKLLFSRTLRSSDFEILLKAYKNLLKENSNKDADYMLLFFQHFCGQSIKTDVLRKDIIDFFPRGLKCAFKQDVINSLSSLIEVLNSTTIEGGNENVLAKYIKALNKSRHKEYRESYQIIIDKCNATINLQTVWNNLADENVIIEPFGNLLCDKYKEDQEFVKKVQEQIASIKENDEYKDVKSSKKEAKEEV